MKSAVAAIRSYFQTGWANETKIVFDDEEYTPQAGVPFVRLNIRHTMGDQATIGAPGNNRHEQLGGLTVQIFTPQGNASVRARELTDKAADLFRGKRTSGIRFYETTPREIGPDGNGFYQINVDVRFQYSLYA
ncbi:phage tail terminator-like protein [Methylobacterium oryzae]|uniref:phage tail terminator-like protein n=1 Tax=Methylobacterium oryzae TaxID=334852 RepID=UPI002F2D11D2